MTSGTLTPFNSFQSELKLIFPHVLENPHVIKNEQVNISIVKRSQNGINFNFNYQNKDNKEMLDDLGRTFASIAKHVPGGMLIFFPSYRLLENVYEQWEKSGVLNVI